MPLPRSSSHPLYLHTLHPEPWHTTQAELELERRLGEGEMVGAPLQRRVRPEERSREELEGALEVAHRDPLVDAEPLDLVKHRHVGGVVVAPIRLAGNDHPLRRAAR